MHFCRKIEGLKIKRRVWLMRNGCVKSYLLHGVRKALKRIGGKKTRTIHVRVKADFMHVMGAMPRVGYEVCV